MDGKSPGVNNSGHLQVDTYSNHESSIQCLALNQHSDQKMHCKSGTVLNASISFRHLKPGTFLHRLPTRTGCRCDYMPNRTSTEHQSWESQFKMQESNKLKPNIPYQKIYRVDPLSQSSPKPHQKNFFKFFKSLIAELAVYKVKIKTEKSKESTAQIPRLYSVQAQL